MLKADYRQDMTFSITREIQRNIFRDLHYELENGFCEAL